MLCNIYTSLWFLSVLIITILNNQMCVLFCVYDICVAWKQHASRFMLIFIKILKMFIFKSKMCIFKSKILWSEQLNLHITNGTYKPQIISKI
jgi:hypothetical protein